MTHAFAGTMPTQNQHVSNKKSRCLTIEIIFPVTTKRSEDDRAILDDCSFLQFCQIKSTGHGYAKRKLQNSFFRFLPLRYTQTHTPLTLLHPAQRLSILFITFKNLLS